MGKVGLWLSFNHGSGAKIMPATLVDARLRSALMRHGFDPFRFNRVRWPVGASQHATLELLFAGDIEGFTLDPTQTVTVNIGEEDGTPVAFTMYALPPVPLLLDDGSRSIFSLPLVDARYHWRGQLADADYNVSLDDKTKHYAGTTNGGTLWTYAGVLDGLKAMIGATVTTSPAANTIDPRDVLASGQRVAEVIDELLAENGLIWTTSFAGAHALAALDAVSAETVIDANVDTLLAGSAIYGTSGDAFVGDSMPTPATWQPAVVPETVRVLFPAYYRDSADRDDTHAVSVTSTTAVPGLTVQSGLTHEIADNHPALMDGAAAVQNSADLTTRATEIATAYLKRFKTGAMDILLGGAVELAPSGVCEVIEISCDPVTGVRTSARSGLHSPVRGRWQERARTPRGTGRTRALKGQGRPTLGQHSWLLRGRITARNGPGGYDDIDPTLVTYDFEDDSGEITGSAATPVIRPFGRGEGTIKAAALNSVCLIEMRAYDATDREAVLFLADERGIDSGLVFGIVTAINGLTTPPDGFPEDITYDVDFGGSIGVLTALVPEWRHFDDGDARIIPAPVNSPAIGRRTGSGVNLVTVPEKIPVEDCETTPVPPGIGEFYAPTTDAIVFDGLDDPVVDGDGVTVTALAGEDLDPNGITAIEAIVVDRWGEWVVDRDGIPVTTSPDANLTVETIVTDRMKAPVVDRYGTVIAGDSQTVRTS